MSFACDGMCVQVCKPVLYVSICIHPHIARAGDTHTGSLLPWWDLISFFQLLAHQGNRRFRGSITQNGGLHAMAGLVKMLPSFSQIGVADRLSHHLHLFPLPVGKLERGCAEPRLNHALPFCEEGLKGAALLVPLGPSSGTWHRHKWHRRVSGSLSCPPVPRHTSKSHRHGERRGLSVFSSVAVLPSADWHIATPVC